MIINPLMHGSAVQTRNTTYLYYNGNENTPLTGGWAQTNYDNNASYSANVQVVKQDKYIQLIVTDGNHTTDNRYACITTNNTINVSDYASWGAVGVYHKNWAGDNMVYAPKLAISTNPYVVVGNDDTSSQYTAFLSDTNTPLTSPPQLEVAWRAPLVGFGTTAGGKLNTASINNGYITLMGFNAGGGSFWAVWLAKHDNIAPISKYGATATDIIANCNALFNDVSALSKMVRYCTGDFMWQALQNSSFLGKIFGINASANAGYVLQNEEWGKALNMILTQETNLLFDSDGEYLMDSEWNLLYSTS